MAMYRFSVASFTAVASRSNVGPDDVWVIVTVSLGTRSGVAAWPVALGVQAGQGVVLPWSAGSEWATEPYQAATGEAGVVAYTLVNLGGSGEPDQEKIIGTLQDRLGPAVTGAAGGGAAAIEAAIRGQFGGAGELLAAPAVAAGAVDCRGLLGVYVAPFIAADAPDGEDVQTTQAMTLTGTVPAACGTVPKSTVTFSVGRSPNLFSQSTPVTALVSGTGSVEIFAVGMDGFVRRNAQGASGGAFGAWQVVGSKTFSQSAALVAVAGTAQRKDVFGTGTDGVIYRWSWTAATGWGEWTAVSALGQFLPDTPVSAISLSGVITLAAVDGSGVAQSIAWNGDTVASPWGPLPGIVFARRTALLLISHVDPWVEVFATDPLGHDFHTSRGGANAAWGPWQGVGGAAPTEPSSRRYCGLTFHVYPAPNTAPTSVGMNWYRVDGTGSVNELGWSGQTSWTLRRVLGGIKTIPAGPVASVQLGDSAMLCLVDAQTGQIAVASRGTPVPFQAPIAWSAWTLLPAGPKLAMDREIAAASLDGRQAILFVVDRNGMVQMLGPGGARGWVWAVV